MIQDKAPLQAYKMAQGLSEISKGRNIYKKNDSEY
jgi:hypothetical protein